VHLDSTFFLAIILSVPANPLEQLAEQADCCRIDEQHFLEQLAQLFAVRQKQ
jgi:hypothetical protein